MEVSGLYLPLDVTKGTWLINGATLKTCHGFYLQTYHFLSSLLTATRALQNESSCFRLCSSTCFPRAVS